MHFWVFNLRLLHIALLEDSCACLLLNIYRNFSFVCTWGELTRWSGLQGAALVYVALAPADTSLRCGCEHFIWCPSLLHSPFLHCWPCWWVFRGLPLWCDFNLLDNHWIKVCFYAYGQLAALFSEEPVQLVLPFSDWISLHFGWVVPFCIWTWTTCYQPCSYPLSGAWHCNSPIDVLSRQFLTLISSRMPGPGGCESCCLCVSVPDVDGPAATEVPAVDVNDIPRLPGIIRFFFSAPTGNWMWIFRAHLPLHLLFLWWRH